MNHYLPLIIVLILIVVLAIGLFFLYEYVEHKVDQNYRELPTKVKVGSGKGMRNCPKGCIRGSCNYKVNCRSHLGNNPKCCAFDFQCQYCRDENGEYYLKPGNNPYIEANYNIADELNSTEELNNAIAEQNRYIIKLNKEIKRKNNEIMNRKAPFSRK